MQMMVLLTEESQWMEEEVARGKVRSWTGHDSFPSITNRRSERENTEPKDFFETDANWAISSEIRVCPVNSSTGGECTQKSPSRNEWTFETVSKYEERKQKTAQLDLMLRKVA